ncbi:hypothetical protein EDC96DRAFT_496902 [Choanephora cucurbitarum]|nr:hypothetical protein EDC96DRAFT_496902 [Choanephora cucurbitarum]
MLTTNFYCYNCQVRRQVHWAPIATCSVCGCTVVDSIPLVDDEDDEEDEEEDESETEDIFIYHINEAEDELDTEERDLLEHLLANYGAVSQPDVLHTEARDRIPNDAPTFTSTEDFLSSLYDRIRANELHQAQSLFSSRTNNSRSGQQYENMISRLKTIRLAINDPDIQEECIICQEHFTSALDLCVLPCEHKYHSECITKWLHVNSSCPICRSTVDEQTTEPIDQLNRGISRQS